MGYYSIVAVARTPVAIPEPMLMLDTGRNVFPVQIEDLEAFLKLLSDEGVQVQEVHRLDQFEPVNPQESLGLPDDDFTFQIDTPNETEEP